MSESLRFWSLTRFPNYSNPRPLEAIDALQITQRDFMERHVHRNRACLVKHAVHHWPAYEKWRDIGYLKTHSMNRPVTIREQVISETIGWSSPEIRKQLRQLAASVAKQIDFHDFLARLERANEPLPLVADSCRFSAGSPLEPLRGDVSGLPFMPTLKKSRLYPPYRVFLYSNSYTDWHFHPTDETFMTQIVGAKEVLLLPPDDESWEGLYPIIEKTGRLYDIDTDRFPGARTLRPYRLTVEPGDAVFIPVFWWHAVESVNDDFGATIAATFPTPLHVNGDMRFPVARKLVRTYLLSRYAPLVLAALGYATVHRLLRGLAGAR
jgi:hypothetical protein